MGARIPGPGGGAVGFVPGGPAAARWCYKGRMKNHPRSTRRALLLSLSSALWAASTVACDSGGAKVETAARAGGGGCGGASGG
jgi:hypothetical protein